MFDRDAFIFIDLIWFALVLIVSNRVLLIAIGFHLLFVMFIDASWFISLIPLMFIDLLWFELVFVGWGWLSFVFLRFSWILFWFRWSPGPGCRTLCGELWRAVAACGGRVLPLIYTTCSMKASVQQPCLMSWLVDRLTSWLVGRIKRHLTRSTLREVCGFIYKTFQLAPLRCEVLWTKWSRAVLEHTLVVFQV